MRYSGFKFSQLEMSTCHLAWLSSFIASGGSVSDTFLPVEIVLCTLLSGFKFELSEKPVVWNFAGVSYPSMGYESTKPSMVLKVSLAA